MKRFDEIRLFEHIILGHGPLWLGYYGTALAPLCRRLTFCYPDRPQYELLNEVSKVLTLGGTAIRLEPIQMRGRDRLEEVDALERACAPGADLTLLTFIDDMMRHGAQLSFRPGAERPEVWGMWFNPAPKEGRLIHPIRSWLSKRARKHRRVQRGLSNPPDWLDGAFFLDSALAERVANIQTRVVPDCWPRFPRQGQREARQALDLPTERKLFLHFGVAQRRKGLADVVDAWSRVPDAAILLRVGSMSDERPPALQGLERAGRAVVRDQNVPERLVDLYFRAADWILLTYRNHEGSSGVLSAATAAQRPVVASEYGVVGRQVRDSQLGILYEHASVDALAGALVRAVDTPISRFTRTLDEYANEHTPSAFNEAMRAAWLTNADLSKDR